MIQNPTNLQPQIIDNITNCQFSFTFNGDVLNWVWLYIYDNDTGEIIYTTCINKGTLMGYGDDESMTYSGQPMAYNGDTVSFTADLSGYLTYGRTYVYKYVLCQANAINTHITPKTDLYIGRGKCKGERITTSAIFIAGNCRNIYEFEKTAMGYNMPKFQGDKQTTVVEVEVLGKRFIVSDYYSYDAMNTGAITTNASEYGEPETIEEGTSFRLYSNYIFTPSYFFKTSLAPTPQLHCHNVSQGIRCVGNAVHPNGVGIKYFNMQLYQNINDEDKLVEESNNIYSQNIEYVFMKSDRYKESYANLTVVYQNGQVVTKRYPNYPEVSDKYFKFEEPTDIVMSNLVATPNKIDGCIDLTWDYEVEFSYRDDYALYIYRTNTYTGLTEFLTKISACELWLDELYITKEYKDYKIGSDVEYTYTIIPFELDWDTEGEVDYASITSNPAKVKFDYWIISPITYLHKEINQIDYYTCNKSWKLIAEIDDVTITQNLNRTLHIGSGVLPSVSTNNSNYATGTLSGMLGYMDCNTKKWVDDINLVKEWREFITQNKQFLLQSPKGDVWVVSVSDNPTTEYEQGNHIATYVSFNWVETEKVDNIIISFGGDM